MKHQGGKCPVQSGVKIDVKFRDGEVRRNVPALEFFDESQHPEKPSYGTLSAFWYHDDMDNDIVSWQHSKPAQNAL